MKNVEVLFSLIKQGQSSNGSRSMHILLENIKSRANTMMSLASIVTLNKQKIG